MDPKQLVAARERDRSEKATRLQRQLANMAHQQHPEPLMGGLRPENRSAYQAVLDRRIEQLKGPSAAAPVERPAEASAGPEIALLLRSVEDNVQAGTLGPETAAVAQQLVSALFSTGASLKGPEVRTLLSRVAALLAYLWPVLSVVPATPAEMQIHAVGRALQRAHVVLEALAQPNVMNGSADARRVLLRSLRTEQGLQAQPPWLPAPRGDLPAVPVARPAPAAAAPAAPAAAIAPGAWRPLGPPAAPTPPEHGWYPTVPPPMGLPVMLVPPAYDSALLSDVRDGDVIVDWGEAWLPNPHLYTAADWTGLIGRVVPGRQVISPMTRQPIPLGALTFYQARVDPNLPAGGKKPRRVHGAVRIGALWRSGAWARPVASKREY